MRTPTHNKLRVRNKLRPSTTKGTSAHFFGELAGRSQGDVQVGIESHTPSESQDPIVAEEPPRPIIIIDAANSVLSPQATE